MASAFAVVYCLSGPVLAAFVWKSGYMSRKIAVATVTISALFGFVILAPLMPVGICRAGQHRDFRARPWLPALSGFLQGSGSVFVVEGRSCGHLCPVGSVRELAWNVPGKRSTLKRPGISKGCASASLQRRLSSPLLYQPDGIHRDLRILLAGSSIGLVVFVLFLAFSVFLYRPVCRGICPFGLLFSIPAHISLYRLRRTGACISCRKCEKACPAHVAGRDASKRECYLCARCTAACPVPGALVYGKGE